MTPFESVEGEVVSLYGQGDYRGALEVLDRNGPHLHRQWERVAYWRICLLTRCGDADQAIDTLEQAMEAGAWWSPRLLETEDDLDPLWDDSRFRELITEMDARRRGWSSVMAGLFVGGTPGHPPLVGLHGRNQVFEVDADRFHRTFGSDFEVAVPESTQRIASDGPVWDDPHATAVQVHTVTSLLWGDRPFVLSGYSQGGRRALQIGLGSGGRVRAVVAVAPMLLRTREIAEVIESIGTPPWPHLFLVVGTEDPALPGVTTIAEHLRDEGLEVALHVEPGVAHGWIGTPREFLGKAHGLAGSA